MNSLKTLKFTMSFSLSLSLLACGSSNPDLAAQPLVYHPQTVEAPKSQKLSDPKVDILFVVDNSGSMKPYQEKMARNIELFANEFFGKTRINYRIGVVPIFDSKYLNDQTVYASGKRKMNPLGELVPLKGLSPKDTKSHLYITRDTINAKEVLKQTVAIGVQWGPEAEESFSPVLAVMDPQFVAEENRALGLNLETDLNKKNDNFYEKDAHLAVIFLTDADDVTLGYSGEQFYRRLIDLKGGDESKVLIAAAIPRACPPTDGAGPIQAFPALLSASHGTLADLCADSFGAKLASFGRLLVKRVAEQRIPVGFTPDINTLQVFYGPEGSSDESQWKLISNVDQTIYQFDPDTNEVVISPYYQIPGEGNVIYVKAIPANPNNAKNGRLRIL